MFHATSRTTTFTHRETSSERLVAEPMTIQAETERQEMVGALAQCRRGVLERANALLNDPSKLPLTERFDALPSVSSLLMTALEELQVAEEELRAQNARLEEQRAGVDEQVRYYRQLFLYIPAPAIITDFYASIRDVNLAAAKLLRRDAAHLDRKPIASLMPPGRREEFRKQLSRVAVADGVRDWHITLNRTGDLPVDVHAHVCHVPGLGATASGMLFWLFRVTDPSN
jgi:PAS domain-containing protein